MADVRVCVPNKTHRYQRMQSPASTRGLVRKDASACEVPRHRRLERRGEVGGDRVLALLFHGVARWQMALPLLVARCE